MIDRMHRLCGLFALLLCFTILTGCAASDPSPEKRAGQVKPIDRVRSGIADVSADLEKTLASLKQASEQSGLGELSRRAAFSENLKSTEKRVAILRADAKELRERASDYLALWSGNVVL